MSEALRWYVIVVAVLVALVGAPVLWRRWPTYKIENKYVWLAVIGLNAAIGYGTAETLWQHIQGGPRFILTAVAETWLLVAVSYHPVDDIRRWSRWRTARRLIRRGK